MSEEMSLLPLGTAVSVKENDNVYIIISRGFQKQKDGTFLAGYRGIPHPFGKTAIHEPVIIAENEITELHHFGYEDEKDEIFAKQQLAKASNPSQENVNQVTSSSLNPISQTIQDDEMEPEYLKDPFYKFRNRK
ncbi:hypothetical protein FACS1894193_11840 [Bacilli bacterium]|nr:hypothetical protein FACS1894193_11840 [Bacilli bacterium]